MLSLLRMTVDVILCVWMCRRVVQMIKSSGFSSCRMGVQLQLVLHINTPATSHWGKHTHTHTFTCCLSVCQLPAFHVNRAWITELHTHKNTHILSASSFHSSVSSVPQWSEKPQVSHLKHVHGRPVSAAVRSISPLAAHLFKLIHTGAYGTVQRGE